MTRSATWLASAAVIALTAGVTSRVDIPTEKELPLPPGSIIIAAQDSAQTDENAEDSAKMGKEEGTQEGGNSGATVESDTSKIDKPARDNPTASPADDYNGTPQ